MFKKHKLISFIFFILAFTFIFSACRYDPHADTERITTAAEQKPIEYDVVEPPEGGWTTEEIMSVTYLCDKKVNYPLSIEYLGNDFRLTDYSRLWANHRLTPSSLRYKGKKLANAIVIEPEKETLIYNIVLFPDICEVEGVEPFVINGIKMYDTFDEVLAALGDNYSYMTENSLSYNDRETHESLYSLFFEDGKLVHINVDFRFEIDLPLYRD